MANISSSGPWEMKSVFIIVMFSVFGRDFYDYYSSDVPKISNFDECDTANRFEWGCLNRFFFETKFGPQRSSKFICNFRIIGGREAQPHKYNFAVRLKIFVDNKPNACGGSLISEKWILTAAHCCDVGIFREIKSIDPNKVEASVGVGQIWAWIVSFYILSPHLFATLKIR